MLNKESETGLVETNNSVLKPSIFKDLKSLDHLKVGKIHKDSITSVNLIYDED